MSQDHKTPEQIQAEQPRHMIQVYHLDNTLDNPVINAYAIQCPDTKSAQMLFELLQRQLQLMTYKPFTDGK